MARRRRPTPVPGPSEARGLEEATRKRLLWTVAALLAVAGLAWFLLAGDGGPPSGEVGYTPVSDFQDVHGLAVDPERPGLLYIATHHGLIRAENGTAFARVGDLQDDYMGFTAHPTEGGLFWVSGHPIGGGNMGVRKSTDGGFTWQQLGLGGIADFHAMTISPADPDRLWGFFRGEVQRSDDGGRTWTIAGRPPQPVLSLTAHPADASTVYGATQSGLLISQDGGASWMAAKEGVHTALAIHPASPQTWYAARPDGIERTTDGGGSWQRTALDVAGTVGYLALHPEDPQTLYAATYQTGLYRSTDGGVSWAVLKPPSR